MMSKLDYLHINPTPYVPQYSQLAANYLVWYLLNKWKTWEIISTTHQSIEYILRQYNKEYLINDLQTHIDSYDNLELFIQSKRDLWILLQQKFNNTNSNLLYEHNHIRYQSIMNIETYDGMKNILDNPTKSIYYDYIQQELIPNIIDKNPKILGISIADKRQLEFVYCLISLLKNKKNNMKIGLWWYLLSVCMPDIINSPLIWNLLFDYIDFIVHNEWEIPLEKYLQYVDWELSLRDVPQLVYKDWNIIKWNSLTKEWRVLSDKMASLSPDEIPNPYFPKELKNQLYMPAGGVVGLLMSRWCPYICSFCAIDKWYNRWAIAVSEMANKEILEKRLIKQQKLYKIQKNI